MLLELERVYQQAGSLYAGWSCPASTECCHFGITGREPYVTSIELALVRRAIASLGGAGALSRRTPASSALPIASDDPASRRCPLLDPASGRCRAYAARPLGCRTFYCDRAAQGSTVRHREVSALVRQVQEIAARHEPEGDKGRPLTRALEATRRPGRR